MALAAVGVLGEAAARPPAVASGWLVDPSAPVATSVAPAPAPAAPMRDADPLWPTTTRTRAIPPARTGVPRQLRIERLGLVMPVEPTGLARDGGMALPERPQELGWYRYGPRPGDRHGATVLAGHVDSREHGVGPLAGLRRLERGDRVVVEHSRGTLTYEVRSVRQVAKQALPLDQVFDRAGPAVLHLLTCGGRFDPRSGYEDNLVVTAVPL